MRNVPVATRPTKCKCMETATITFLRHQQQHFNKLTFYILTSMTSENVYVYTIVPHAYELKYTKKKNET